jgi:hypothetical protein
VRDGKNRVANVDRWDADIDDWLSLRSERKATGAGTSGTPVLSQFVLLGLPLFLVRLPAYAEYLLYFPLEYVRTTALGGCICVMVNKVFGPAGL